MAAGVSIARQVLAQEQAEVNGERLKQEKLTEAGSAVCARRRVTSGCGSARRTSAGVVLEPGAAQPVGELPRVALGDLVVDEQAESLLEREGVDLEGFRLPTPPA